MFLRSFFLLRLGVSLAITLLSFVFVTLATHRTTILVLFLSVVVFTTLRQPEDSTSNERSAEKTISKKEATQNLTTLREALMLQPSHQDLLYNTVVLEALLQENTTEDTRTQLQRVAPAVFAEL